MRLRQEARPVQAEDVRRRALHDAKGKLLLTGTIPSLGHVDIYRLVHRCDQFDVFLNHHKALTGGRRKLADWLGALPIDTSHEEHSLRSLAA